MQKGSKVGWLVGNYSLVGIEGNLLVKYGMALWHDSHFCEVLLLLFLGVSPTLVSRADARHSIPATGVR